MMKKISALFLFCFLLTSSAGANLPADIGIMASIRTATGCTPLVGSISSELFELDATCSSSYGGSGQTWANINPTPADSSGQTAYDFYLGATSSATTDDPTFNGTPGSSSAYWSLDGGDLFQIQAGNTTALGNIHKTTGGQPVTMCIAFETASSISTENLMGTEASGGPATGWSMRLQGATSLRNVHVVSGSSFNTSYTTTFSVSTNYLTCIAIDFTGNSIKFANDANSFTGATLTHGTTTVAASHAFQIGSADTLANVTSGTRIYGVYAFNVILTDGNLATIVTALNARHGRTYALLNFRPETMFAANEDRETDQTLGHVEATVVDTKTVSDCDPADPDSNCLPVLPVPECPIGKPALDCIPVE